MRNPLVGPPDNIRFSDEYVEVDNFIDEQLEKGRLISLEEKHGADLYVALERIAARKTGFDYAQDTELAEKAYTDAQSFCELANVRTEAGGYALYRLVSNAVDHHDCYANGQQLKVIADHYSNNKNND